MPALGLDIGTKNIVLSYRHGKKVGFLQEVNGYYVYPNESKFVENMLSDPNRERSDGTKRPARWVKYEGRPGLYLLGKDAEELAYAHNDTLQRPMAVGSIAHDEDAMMVLATIIQSMLGAAENEIGEFAEDAVDLCYCTTAKAINSDSINIDYQRQVMNLIIDGYQSKSKINQSTVKESHAIVLKESPDGTGIGLSFGAGTTTVSYCKFGVEVYSFCWAGAGDWIDIEVAKRQGYDPNSSKRSQETPTTVCRAKEKIDLNTAVSTTDRLTMDIALHYQLLVQNVIGGIAQGFLTNESQARIDTAVPFYIAGGTSSPPGFVELVEKLLAESNLPFAVGKVTRSVDPLLAVAEGCLIAAENQV